MVWSKAGTTTLGSAGDNIVVSSVSGTFFQTISSTIASGAIFHDGRFNSDTGSNYAYRYNDNGGTDGTGGTTDKVLLGAGGTSTQGFSISYISNISGEEKLVTTPQGVAQGTAGAANAPTRRESVSKWTGTAVIDSITAYNGNSGDYDINSNLSVLGSEGVESLNVQDGAVFYDTDLNKSYVLYNGSWTEL
tara:strand:- start:1110 stop:1682 length:573 start_codon:yes stop_codon:yes gene_type:complete